MMSSVRGLSLCLFKSRKSFVLDGKWVGQRSVSCSNRPEYGMVDHSGSFAKGSVA